MILGLLGELGFEFNFASGFDYAVLFCGFPFVLQDVAMIESV